MQRPHDAIRQLATFSRSIDLLVCDEIVALVLPELGNGPFSIVVDHLPPTDLRGAVPSRWHRGSLLVGPWVLELESPVQLWDPSPAWETLHPRRDSLARLATVVSAAALYSPASASPLSAAATGRQPAQITTFVAALQAAADGGTLPDIDTLSLAASRIAGWGPGLTPSGDDFLAGCMLALWSGQHPLRRSLCSAISTAAQPRTNRLSAAFLRAAAVGHATEAWHGLLEALAAPDPVQIEPAASAILACGASSGFDCLMGYIITSRGLVGTKRYDTPKNWQVRYGTHPTPHTFSDSSPGG